MPLQVNKKDMDITDVCKLFGISPVLFNKEAIVFKRNPARKKKYGFDRDAVPIFPVGMGMKTFFTVKLGQGKVHHIRYYLTETPTEIGGKFVPDFEPKRAVFLREAEMFDQENADLALFLFLYSACKESPWARPDWEYSIVDDDAEANKLIGEYNILTKALNAVTNITSEQVVLLCLGLNMPESRTANTNSMVMRAALQKRAHNNPVAFLDSIGNHADKILFAGKLRTLIQRKAFIAELVFATVMWKWGKGSRAGQDIIPVPAGTDANTVLINHIQGNISSYYEEINGLYLSTSDESVVEDFFASQPKTDLLAQDDIVVATEPDVYQEPEAEDVTEFMTGDKDPYDQDDPNVGVGTVINRADGFADPVKPVHPFGPLPQSYKDAMAYVQKHNGKGSTSLASTIAKGVADGSITLENVAGVLKS